jgi:hypothetical protein
VADAYPHKRLELLVAAWRGLGSDRPSLTIIGRELEGSPSAESGLTFVTRGSSGCRRCPAAVGARGPDVRQESLACGTPLVASDIPAYREVTGGHAAFVAGSGAQEWTAAIAQALSHPPDGLPGQGWASQFTWARCADQTARLPAAAARAGA